MNQKCPGCGLINWADAPECKRCRAPLQGPEEGVAAMPWAPVFERPKPAIALGVLMIIWGVLTLTSGLLLLTYGKPSHVLVLGPAMIFSGIWIVQGRRWATAPYFVGIQVMFFWHYSEGKITLALVSCLYAALIGLLITKRRWPILAGVLMVFSSLAFVGAMMLPILLRPAKVAVVWRSFQPAQGNFTLQMPAETVARETRVEQVKGYTLTKHPYESRVPGQGGVIYIVVEFSPALAVSDTSMYEKILDAELDNFLKNTNSTLLFKQPLACHGYPGLSFEVKPPENLAMEKPRVLGRIFMNADHLYVMQLTGTESSELIASSIKFLDPVPLHQADGPQAQR